MLIIEFRTNSAPESLGGYSDLCIDNSRIFKYSNCLYVLDKGKEFRIKRKTKRIGVHEPILDVFHYKIHKIYG
jgi:hypothetical protein